MVRALVPNGVAQLDGRLMPGQRLVRINEVNLDDTTEQLAAHPHLETPLNQPKNLGHAVSNANIPKLPIDLLKFAVDLLKSLPVGKTVRLGVQKPLPYPDAQDLKSSSPKHGLKQSVTNSKSVSHLSSSKEEEKIKIRTTPLSTQVTRRDKSADASNKIRPRLV